MRSPQSAEEIAELLREASAAKRIVAPVGGGTRSRRGRPGDPGAPVPTGGMRAVIEHTPAELTATVEAGIPGTDLADRLAAVGQWWPQADIRPGSSVGGVLATAASGRGRLRHGPVRDSLLEVVLVTGDGRIVKGGGRTVKGVAGYDLPRLAVGSLGTLGVIAQVTLKLWPLPPARGWFVLEGALEERLAVADRVRRERWRPAALLLTPGRLSIELVGAVSDVTAPDGAGPGDAPAEPAARGTLDIGVPPGAVAVLARELESRGDAYLAEYGVGACRVAIETPDDVTWLRALAVAHGGHAVVSDGPDDLRADPWGLPPPGVEIMRRLKRAFDPAGILSPSRFAGAAA